MRVRGSENEAGREVGKRHVCERVGGKKGGGMWPEAKCGNRGHRPRLQWRLSRLRRCFGFGFFGSQTVPVWIVFITRARRSGYLLTH